jgi:hypothetical protein
LSARSPASPTTGKAKSGAASPKKEGNDKKAIDKAKNEAGQYPQSYQEDDCQKAAPGALKLAGVPFHHSGERPSLVCNSSF